MVNNTNTPLTALISAAERIDLPTKSSWEVFKEKFEPFAKIILATKTTCETAANSEGSFRGFIQDGKIVTGTFFAKDLIYSGFFEDGIPSGSNCELTINGIGKYEGDLAHYKKEGQGKMTIPNGATYVGGWENNKRHGQGKMTYSDGITYEGDWKNGLQHGKGKEIYRDGTTYVGGWENSLRHGHGKRTYSDGSYYEGNFVADKRHGKGKMTYPNGTTREGNWENDKLRPSDVVQAPVGGITANPQQLGSKRSADTIAPRAIKKAKRSPDECEGEI